MSSQNNFTKTILVIAALSLAVLFLIPMFFLGRGSSSTTTPVAVVSPPPPPPMASSKINPAKTANNTSEFQELESFLAGKGTSICAILKTIDIRKNENFKIALAKFPNEDTKQGQHLMELNQEALNAVKTQYDIDRRVLGQVFRLGSAACN